MMNPLHRDSIHDNGRDAERPDAKLARPFSGWTHQKMTDRIDKFIDDTELEDYAHYIRRGAFLAQSKAAFDRERDDGLKLKDIERTYLDLEYSRKRIDKFKQPWRLYALVALCSIGAAVQGWDETAVNGGWSRVQPCGALEPRMDANRR